MFWRARVGWTNVWGSKFHSRFEKVPKPSRPRVTFAMLAPMSSRPKPGLPIPAPHGLRFEAQNSVESEAKYLRLTSFLVTREERSARYDVLGRKALDAAVVVPYFLQEGKCFIRLRTVVRPPLAVRKAPPAGTAMPPSSLWEVPAGLIEPGEDAAVAAARELFEELAVRPQSLEPLGPPMCPAPAVLGELHVYFAAELQPPAAGEDWPIPDGDGSLYEENAEFVTVSLADALEACRQGEVWDAKTELALRRLAEKLAE